jgi:hypothetical protein
MALVDHIQTNMEQAILEQQVFTDDYVDEYDPELCKIYSGIEEEAASSSNYSYHPKINDLSRRMTEGRSTTPVYERLHN